MAKNLLQSGLVISAMTMISRLLGLVRDVVIARYFPVDGATDAFFVAFKIPNLLRRFFAEGAFASAFVPVVAEYQSTKGFDSLKALIAAVAGLLGLVLTVVSLIGTLSAPWLIHIIAPGFSGKDPGQMILAGDLLRITFPYIGFISLAGMVGGILNAHNRFAIPAITPALLNVVMIAFAIWGAPYFQQPVMALAWGVFCAGLVQLLFQLPSLIKLGLLPMPTFDWRHTGVQKILKLMGPAMLGSSAAQLNILFNTILASLLTVGSISWLYYSDRFVELPLAIIGVALGTVILPKLSRDHAQSSAEAFGRTLAWAMRCGLIVAMPAMIGLIMLAEPILATIIMHGEFSWHDTQMAALSLQTYALGLPAFVLIKVLAPGFFAKQDTKTPVRFALIAIGTNVLFNLCIVLPWHYAGMPGAHAGLALATALSAYVNVILLGLALKRAGQLAWPTWLVDLMRTFAGCLLMGVALLIATPDGQWWEAANALAKGSKLIVLLILAGLSYFGLLWAMGWKPKQMLSPSSQ